MEGSIRFDKYNETCFKTVHVTAPNFKFSFSSSNHLQGNSTAVFTLYVADMKKMEIAVFKPVLGIITFNRASVLINMYNYDEFPSYFVYRVVYLIYSLSLSFSEMLPINVVPDREFIPEQMNLKMRSAV